METATGGEAPTVELADELVDEASISDGRVVVRFSRTQAALADLEKRFKGATFDMATTKGDAAARAARKELMTVRTTLEKRRKSLKEPAIEFSRLIDSQALALKIAIEALEDPIDQQIKLDEQRREDERQAKLAAEQKRCDDHRARIADISAVAQRAVGLPSAEIQAKIDLVTRIEIDATFEEFEAAAGNVKHETLLALKDLHTKALAAEAEAERVAADRARLQQLERENAERLAAEQAEQRKKAEDEQRVLAAQQAATAARQIQSNLARGLIDEIHVIQTRIFTSSADGMLELAGLIEGIKIGEELGDFEGSAQKAKEDALATLHMAHWQAVKREAEEKQLRETVAKQEAELAAKRRADAVASEQADDKAAGTWGFFPVGGPPEIAIDGAGDQFAALPYVAFDTSQPIESMETAVPADVRDARINDTPVEEFIDSLPQAMQILGVDFGHEMPRKEEAEGFVRVPVLRNFDQAMEIGKLTLLKSELPPTPDFVFSLAFQVLEMAGEEFGAYELHAVSIQSDGQYLGYLQKMGKAPIGSQELADYIIPLTPASKHDISDAAPNINTAEICKRLGFVLQVAFIEDVLKVPHGEKIKAVYWRASDWPAIISALVAHVKGAL